MGSAPPPLDADSPYRVRTDRRYAGIDIPHSESLKDTIARVLPYYEAAIVFAHTGCRKRWRAGAMAAG